MRIPACTRWSHTRPARDGAAWLGLSRRDGATSAATMACFKSALDSVRRWGGVLEHYSDAWAAFDLPRPSRSGGWQRGMCGGWSCHVEQGRYGHPAKKATWLYAYGTKLPDLLWGSDPDQQSTALVSWCGNRVASGESRPRVGKRAASHTPEPFRDVLLETARTAKP
jgi:hypothetical protein